MFLLHQPTQTRIDEFIAQGSLEPLSYDAIGLARVGEPGFTMDVHDAVVGRGEEAFKRARQALAGWAHFDLDWVQLGRDGTACRLRRPLRSWEFLAISL